MIRGTYYHVNSYHNMSLVVINAKALLLIFILSYYEEIG